MIEAEIDWHMVRKDGCWQSCQPLAGCLGNLGALGDILFRTAC